MRTAVVVKEGGVAIFHGMRIECDEAPRSSRVGDRNPIVRLAHIRPVAHREKALQVEPVFLATDPDRYRSIPQRLRDRDKRLLDAEAVLINQREAFFFAFSSAVALCS
jgi:hypothetical protein